jgi:hypothetical protein
MIKIGKCSYKLHSGKEKTAEEILQVLEKVTAEV